MRMWPQLAFRERSAKRIVIKGEEPNSHESGDPSNLSVLVDGRPE
jgi:hypothetical protein